MHARMPHAFRMCAATTMWVVLWRRSIKKAARHWPSRPIDAAEADMRAPLPFSFRWLKTIEKVGKSASWEMKTTSPRYATMCLVSGRQRAREGAIEAVGKLAAAETEKDEDTLHDDAMPQHVVAGCAVSREVITGHMRHLQLATGFLHSTSPFLYGIQERAERECRQQSRARAQRRELHAESIMNQAERTIERW